MRQRWLAITVPGMLLGAAGARAVPDRLLQIIPADALAVVLLDRHPGPDGDDGRMVAERLAAALLQHTRGMGLIHHIDPTAGIIADAMSLLPELSRYPRAIVLLDVQAEPLSGGSFRVGDISMGLVVRSGADHLRIGRSLQALLNLNADQGTARLTRREAYGTTIQTLADERLPGWAVVEWGAVDDCYLITVGFGAFGRLASTVRDRTTSLGAQAWFAAAHRRCRGAEARWEWTVDFAALRGRLTAVMGEKPREVLEGLGLGDVRRGLWTVGPDGRAVDAACVLDVAGDDRYIPITVTDASARAFEHVIPPQARSGAIIRARPREMIPRACEAYLAARRPSVRSRLTTHWKTIESEVGVSAQADILDHLGPHVVVHDFPQHPLRLPLFRTILVEIDGPADSVRTALDRLLARTKTYIADRSGSTGLTRLMRDADGVWYLQFGFYGPAATVTDHWVVISYSPQAVRQNVEYLESLYRTFPAPTVTGP